MSNTLNTGDLIQKVHVASGAADVTRTQMEKIVKTVFATIKESVNNGDRVTIRDFGRFEPAERKGREMNLQLPNQAAKGKITVPAKIVPKFRASNTWAKDCNEVHSAE